MDTSVVESGWSNSTAVRCTWRTASETNRACNRTAVANGHTKRSRFASLRVKVSSEHVVVWLVH